MEAQKQNNNSKTKSRHPHTVQGVATDISNGNAHVHTKKLILYNIKYDQTLVQVMTQTKP